MLGILSLLEVAMTFMASISKITLNSNTYEFKEAKDPIVIKTFESPPFSKEYMYGMHTFEINEVGPDGYKAVGIVHNDTTGVVFPCNVVFFRKWWKNIIHLLGVQSDWNGVSR